MWPCVHADVLRVMGDAVGWPERMMEVVAVDTEDVKKNKIK